MHPFWVAVRFAVWAASFAVRVGAGLSRCPGGADSVRHLDKAGGLMPAAPSWCCTLSTGLGK